MQEVHRQLQQQGWPVLTAVMALRIELPGHFHKKMCLKCPKILDMNLGMMWKILFSKTLSQSNRGSSTFSNNRGNTRNRFMGTRTNVGEPVCLRCRCVGHAGRVCTWRDPRIPTHYMQGNYYRSRPAVENSNASRGVMPENSAVRGRGTGSIPRGGSGRFGGLGYCNFREFRPHDSSRRTVRSEGIMRILTRNKIIHFPHMILTMNLNG